jgi:hypothetical protein
MAKLHAGSDAAISLAPCGEQVRDRVTKLLTNSLAERADEASCAQAEVGSVTSNVKAAAAMVLCTSRFIFAMKLAQVRSLSSS